MKSDASTFVQCPFQYFINIIALVILIEVLNVIILCQDRGTSLLGSEVRAFLLFAKPKSAQTNDHPAFSRDAELCNN